MLRIIPCTTKHYALLADIGSNTFYQTFKPYQNEDDLQTYIAKNYNLQTVKKNTLNPNIIYFVAYNSTQEVGYIKLLKNIAVNGLNQPVMELEKIYVLPEFWDTKAGAALMQQAILCAKQNGFKYLYLGVWQENIRAIKFYEKFGFKTVDTRSFQLGSTICQDYMMLLEV